MTERPVHVIGGGLAGSEAAWQIAERGVPVVLHEMRPVRQTDAHQTDGLAELVCSNSFRSDDVETNAVGLLHEEMRRAGSLIMRCGDANKLPAGGALAVDRDAFSADVTAALDGHPLITISREEVDALPPEDWASTIIATGPLTSPALSDAIQSITDEDALAFFDAIAPIVHFDTIDMAKAWKQSRYDKAGPGGSGADYINCAMDKAQYEAFIDALLAGDKTSFKEWEENTPYFNGCLPIEVMAERGRETLRHGPMKPVGLTNPHPGAERPYAVVQLRQDNALGTLWNMVGFQTKLKYGAQREIFRMIPGLENAEFARLGGLHRNTFLNSPSPAEGPARPAFRRPDHRLRGLCRICGHRFAGRPFRCRRAARRNGFGCRRKRPHSGRSSITSPAATSCPADEKKRSFQPMNVNFGLFPPLPDRRDEETGRPRRALARQGQGHRQEARDDRPRQARCRGVAGRRGRARRGIAAADALACWQGNRLPRFVSRARPIVAPWQRPGSSHQAPATPAFPDRRGAASGAEGAIWRLALAHRRRNAGGHAADQPRYRALAHPQGLAARQACRRPGPPPRRLSRKAA
jgi:methylenetetrahydrofolate--tRNA-(uracil-5-)-methyltransferase